MPTATPSDVRGLIKTDLSDSEIQHYLDDAQFDNEVARLSTEHIKQLEKHLAALKIRQTKDRQIDEGGQESTNVSLGGTPTAFLRLALEAEREAKDHVPVDTGRPKKSLAAERLD